MANEVRGKKPGKEWLIAESIAWSMGIFSTLAMTSNPQYYPTTILSIFILTVLAVALLVYAQRKRASGVALVGGSLLASYAWLQLVIVPIGFGWGAIRLLVFILLLLGSADWILKSPKVKFEAGSQRTKPDSPIDPQK